MLMANGCGMRYTKCTMPEFDNETYDLPSDEMNNNKLNKLKLNYKLKLKWKIENLNLKKLKILKVYKK